MPYEPIKLSSHLYTFIDANTHMYYKRGLLDKYYVHFSLQRAGTWTSIVLLNIAETRMKLSAHGMQDSDVINITSEFSVDNSNENVV